MPMPTRIAGCAAVCMLASAMAHGAEIVTLRSGFTLTCARHEEVSPDTVRLHTSAENYVDVPAAAIATVESAPDPVASVPAAPAPKAQDILESSGARHNINVDLLASVIQAESAGNPHAVSRTGARGLMQLMPGTAAELGVHDSFAPADNVNGGSAYLDQLLTRYHDNLPLALAAYNAGPAAVDRYRGIPPFAETRVYVARVIREFNRRVARTQNAPMQTAQTQTAAR